MNYIRFFNELSMKDIPLVGGKNASLGYMVSHMSKAGITVPNGFAITADAYWYVLEYNNLLPELKQLMETVSDDSSGERLRKVGAKIRALIASATLPDDLIEQIKQAYEILSQEYGVKSTDVAVRSSATAEDLPTASFAGQQETYLNINGVPALLEAVRKGMASLFTDRAIIYRREKGFDDFQVALSIGVQKMVRSDKACSGVAFSLDTETGFRDVVMINASYGLGEAIVQGLVTPDEYMVHKPTLKNGFKPLIKKQLGDKRIEMVYAGQDQIKTIDVPHKKAISFALTDEEIFSLARMIMTIEEVYSKNAGEWSPMDVEWAKDGIDGKLYIVQARSETVHRAQAHQRQRIVRYTLPTAATQTPLLTGQSIGQQMVAGPVRIVKDVSQIDDVKQGDILVTTMTDPDWVPIMKRAAGIITERGGRTCHAAIVSRELGIPAIIGVADAMKALKNNQLITLDCAHGDTGVIYDGVLPYQKEDIIIDTLPTSPVAVMVNSADPSQAFATSFLPVAGVGLARLEFIITNAIKIHPMALVHPEKVTDKHVRKQIAEITAVYTDGKTFFIEVLAQHVGMIAAAFYPRPVIVRLSDFKTNEYKRLIGGVDFEQEEENPMLGFRGASRYYNERYQEAFALECAALKKVREDMGLTNVKIMVPFVRTIKEAERVIACMETHGLRRGDKGLELVMMCEIPSNVVLIEQFARYFDGFSIGSNDLAQLTLGIDRDSELLSDLFDERDEAVKTMFAMAIAGAHKANKYIGICGQAPSDYPEIAQFLIDHKIDSLSLNADSVIPFLTHL